MIIVIRIINIIVELITILVIAKIVLSYFMDPYHPVRMWIDRIVDPMLAPIRRVVPPVGMLDLSPIIFLVIVQILGSIIIKILLTII